MMNLAQINNQPSQALLVLLGTDKIIVKQKKEMWEIALDWESNNRYEVYNGNGQMIFLALEDTNCCARMCLSSARPFVIRILDPIGQQLMVIDSDCECCCMREIRVQYPPGVNLATIKQGFGCAPSFYINNAGGDLMFKITSSFSAICCSCCSDVEFDVLSNDQKTLVGKITKQWGGFLKETFTDADTFGISFPGDLAVEWKAVLMAATFAVDFKFYETSSNNHRSS